MRRRLLRSRWGLALLGLALAIRLVALNATAGYVPHHDDHSYLVYAIAMDRTGALPVLHHGAVAVPTAYRAPGWPALLALARAAGGPSVVPLRLVQVAVGVGLVAAIGAVAAILWGRRAGLAAMALAAVAPPLVLFGASLLSEPLFALLETLAVLCALLARCGRRRWAALVVATGALGAAAALVRPAGLAVLPALAWLAAPAGHPRRVRWGAAAATVLVGVAAIAPWTARNVRVLHAFVPISTEAGNTLAGTYNDASWHDRRAPDTWRDPRLSGLYRAARRAHRFDPAATDRALQHAVAGWIARHPLAPLRVAAHDGARLAGLAPTRWSALSLKTVSLRGDHRRAWVLRAGLLATTLLALGGLLTRRARRAPAGWWASGALVAAAAVLVNGEQRFVVPLQPWLLALGGLALATACERWSALRTSCHGGAPRRRRR